MRMDFTAVSKVGQDTVPPLILMMHPEQKSKCDHDGGEQKGEYDRVTLDVSGRIIVDVGAHDGKTLAYNFGQGPGDAALGEAAGVDGEPVQLQHHGGIDAAGNKAGADHLNRGGADGQQNNVADAGNDETEDDEGPFAVDAVADDGQTRQRDECDGIGNHGEELGSGGSVAKVFDEGWEEVSQGRERES